MIFATPTHIYGTLMGEAAPSYLYLLPIKCFTSSVLKCTFDNALTKCTFATTLTKCALDASIQNRCN